MLPTKIIHTKRRFYLIASLLILFAGCVYFNDTGKVGLVTHDERWVNLVATGVRVHGVPQLLAESIGASNAQGRVGFRLMFVPFLSVYLVDPEMRPALITFVQILTYIVIALFSSFYLGVPTALLVLACLLCFLTHPGLHYPDAANPVIFHLSLMLLFAGLTLQRWARRPEQPGRPRYALTALACALVFLGVSSYEALVVACFIAECAIIYSLAAELGMRERRAAILRAVRLEAPIAGTLVLFTIVYAGFRALHPSRYAGNTLGDEPLHFGAIIKSVALYGVGGWPGANWFLGLSRVLLGRELVQGVRVPVFLIHHLGWPEGILGLGVAATVWFYMRRWAEWAPAQRVAGPAGTHSIFFWRRRGLLVAAVALFIAFAAQVPISLSPKYNQNPMAWAPHVSGLFGFVGFCIGAPALLMAISMSAGGFRTAAAWIVALASLLLCVASREASMLVVSARERDYASSRIMDAFLKSKAFAAIPDGSVLVAPSLWDSPTLSARDDAGYWERYINLRARRSLQVRASLPDKSTIPYAPGGMYYVEPQWAAGGERLLISPFYRRPVGGGLVSNSLTVLAQDPLDDNSVVFEQPLDTPAQGADTGILAAEPLQSRYDGTMFAATVAVADGFIPGTAFVVSRDAGVGSSKLTGLGRGPYEPSKYALSGKVRVEFGDGFFPLEQTGQHYWHWSRGSQGSGEVALWNQTESPLKAVFEGCITTGYALPSRTVLKFGGQSAEFASDNNCSRFSQVWTLAPGRNSLSIHSDAARLQAAPGDSRYIVFGIFDWKVREPETIQPAPEELNDPAHYPLSGKVRIEFGNGFSVAEHSPGHYWHWSDGPSGAGEVIFWNRTSQPLKVVFNACVKTGFAQPSRLTLDFKGKREVLSANNACTLLSRVWTLVPGKSVLTIHSAAPRLPAAPGDPRYIVFGLFDWKLTLDR